MGLLFDLSGFDKEAFASNFDREQEMELLNKFRAGDKAAGRRLRRAYKGMVDRIIQQKLPSSGQVDRSQLEIRAEKILNNAFKKYDPSRAVQLSTYVFNELNGNLGNAVSENILGPQVTRGLHAKLNRLVQAKREAQLNYGPNPTKHQIIEFFPGINTIEEFDEIDKYHVEWDLGSKTTVKDDSPLQFKDMFTDFGDVKEDRADVFRHIEIDRLREVAKRRLTTNEYQVVDKHIFQGMGISQTSLSSGMSSSKVYSILRHWEEILKEEGLK